MSCDHVARLKYYRGQLLSARDFNDQQEYHRLKHQLLLRRFEAGIIGGLEVTCAPREESNPTDFDGFLIREGLAVDSEGRELVVPPQGYKIPVTEFTVEKPYLSLQYFEQEDRVGTNTCETATRNNRIYECVAHRWEASPNIAPSVTVALIRVEEEVTGSCSDFTIELVQDPNGRRVRLNARLVDTDQLADSAVTTEKIRNRAVAAEKISDDVRNRLVTDGNEHDHTEGSGGRQIPEQGLADQAVTTRKLHPEVLDLMRTPPQFIVYVGNENTPGFPLLNGMALTGEMLMQGLRMEFQETFDTTAFNQATCQVSLEMPYPMTEAERAFWENAVTGYRIHTLPGGVTSGTDTVYWFSLVGLREWLEEKVFLIRRRSVLQQAGRLNTAILGPGREHVGGSRPLTLARQLLIDETQYLYAKFIANTADVEFGLLFNREGARNYWAVVYREYKEYQSGPGEDFWTELATWTHRRSLTVVEVRNAQPAVRFQDEIVSDQSTASPLYVPAGREVHLVIKQTSTGLLVKAGDLQTRLMGVDFLGYSNTGFFMRDTESNQLVYVKAVFPNTVESLYPGADLFDPYRGTRLLTRLTLKTGAASGADDTSAALSQEAARWFWLVPEAVYYPYPYYGYPFPAVDFVGIGGSLI